MKKPSRFWRWVAGGIVLAVTVICAALMPVKDWSQELEALIERMDPAAGLLVFCSVYVIAKLLLVPGWIFPLVAGAVFGIGWRLFAAVVSATLSAVAAFLIGRYVMRKPLEKAARKNTAFQTVDRAVAKEPRKIVALLRLSPVMPSSVKSYFLGLTRVRLPDYAFASLVGMFPGLLLKVYVGSAGRGALATTAR